MKNASPARETCIFYYPDVIISRETHSVARTIDPVRIIAHNPRIATNDNHYFFEDSYFIDNKGNEYNHSLASMSLALAYSTYGQGTGKKGSSGYYSNYDANNLVFRCKDTNIVQIYIV